MERQKREQNAIIIHFMFYLVLTLWIVIYFFSSILWQIKQIEEKKTQTQELYNNINRIEKSGLVYDEFKALTANETNNTVIKEILKNITPDFYTNNLVNTTYANYKEFLDNRVKVLNNSDNKKKVAENNDKISKILPPYSDTAIDFSENALTDYKFVNYVESIIETFNFNNENPIWISKVNLIDDYAINKADWDSLDSNIYYIPLNLVLSGTKAWVIDFLYYIENVGNINVIDNNIVINDNYWFLSTNGIKKVLEWDKLSADYNIFEHQMIDIDKITFNEYIDTTYVTRWENKFIDFILKTQWNDRFEVNVNLMFYVKWQPTYKIVEYINQILNKHMESVGLVNTNLQKTDIDWLERVNLNKYNDTLKQLNEEIVTIRKNLWNPDKLEELYKRAVKIDELVSPIFKNLKK